MGVRIANVVFDAPGETLDRYAASAGSIASLYAELLGARQCSRADRHRASGWPGVPDAGDEVDPLVFTIDASQPDFAFELELSTYLAPRWPDPAFPQQLHLDVEVRDLDAAEAVVLRHGGRRLAAFDDHRVCTDAVGHPLCLVLSDAAAAPDVGRVARIVFDGPSPRALASFWGQLLDWFVTIVDTPERVEIGDGSDGHTLAFQRSDGPPPEWPNPARPQQAHVDLRLGDVDPDAVRARALDLGATPLPYLGGGHALADPAGHPFCLCD